KTESSPGNPATGAGSKTGTLLTLVNTVAVVATAGLLYYTKLLYKRPAITEEQERTHLKEAHVAKPVDAPVSGLIGFEPITVNIESVPRAPKPADGTTRQIEGKLHYATLGFSLEIQDMS